MANQSILAAFERMWQHVTVALSNKINKPSTATAGQVIAVKTVDENGVPTDFETKDLNSELPLFDLTSMGLGDINVDSDMVIAQISIDGMGAISDALSKGTVRFKYTLNTTEYISIPTVQSIVCQDGTVSYDCAIMDIRNTDSGLNHVCVNISFFKSNDNNNATINATARTLTTKSYVDANATSGENTEIQVFDYSNTFLLNENNNECEIIIDSNTASNIESAIKSHTAAFKCTINGAPFTIIPTTAEIQLGDIGVQYLCECTISDYNRSDIIIIGLYIENDEQLLHATYLVRPVAPSLPEITDESEGKVLGVQDGVLAWVDGVSLEHAEG